VEPGGAAQCCGLLQDGDRILAINGQSTHGRSLREITDLIQKSVDQLNLLIEFDVAGELYQTAFIFNKFIFL